MTVYLEISDVKLKSKIGKEIEPILTKAIRRTSEKSVEDVKKLIRNITVQHPTYQSITGEDGAGKLRGEFGLTSTDVSFFEDNIHDFFVVLRKPVKSTTGRIGSGLKIEGGFRAYIDYREVPLYSHVTERGSLIPWMEWLLFGGTAVQVSGWNVRRKNGLGRSNLAVMRKSSNAGGRSYSVTSSFAGTISKNFLTEILGFAALKTEIIIQKSINKEI